MVGKLERSPNFFLIGAAKAGTTSVWNYLRQHPEIFMPGAIKEPAYYCKLYGMKDYKRYLSLFGDSSDAKAVGEASHAYLTSEESCLWIKHEHPNAKIVIILRDPVERAYSLYKWMVSHGYEWVYPFKAAVEEEYSRICDSEFKNNNPEYYFNYLYLHSGLYSNQVKRYLDHFDRKQVLVLLFDDLVKETVKIMREIYAHLEVSVDFTPKVAVYNASSLKPKSVKGHFFLKNKGGRYKKGFRGKIRKSAMKINGGLLGGKWPDLDELSRQSLKNWFRDDIGKTSRLIGRDLSIWLDNMP